MKKIVSGAEALHKILSGVNLIADAVKKTLGPSGRNAIYSRLGTNQPISSRDGVTVAREIQAEDVHEQMGVALIQGVANEAVDQSGDGTTTATLLAQAIFGEGVKAITVGANPVALKRVIEKATLAVVKSLKEMSRPVQGDMIRQVATISANNDEFLGGLIAEAMSKAGADGVVTVEVSRKPESSLDVINGLQIGTGFISPDFINNPERNECVLEDVAIFLHEKKLSTVQPGGPFGKLIQQLAADGRSLLVIAEDVTDEALAVLSISAQKGPLRCAAVKTPGGVEHLHDIAALTGATVVTEFIKLKDVQPEYFGTAKKVILKPQSTTIMVEERSPRLEKRLTELRTQVTEATDEGTRLRTQSRLARLAGGVAIIRVGAATELEMLERKDRIEDAMHATRCAQKEGVLPGGGVALLHAGDEIPLDLDGDEQAGANIIRRACAAPIRTLAENCGESPDYILREVNRLEQIDRGWNARTNEYGDMYAFGVIDPLRVVRTALESAASVAALMLITHTLIANSDEKRS